MKKKNLAFTLAEVLIVIGIIGVVAALTLPNLNHATGDKEKVTKVKKIYSNLTEAIDRAQAIYGPFDTWFNDLSTYAEKSERAAKRITEFMKVSKDCGFDEGCWSSNELIGPDGNLIDGTENYLSELQRAQAYMIQLSDGISLAFSSNSCHIRVDIDGPNKGKNQVGNDLFDFIILSYDEGEQKANVLYPSGAPYERTGSINELYKGNYATLWVIQNENLDYLKCYDELDWQTKTSCE